MENFIKSKEKYETKCVKFSLILWKYHTKFSSLLRRVNEVLKFAKQNKFKKYLFIYVNLLERI